MEGLEKVLDDTNKHKEEIRNVSVGSPYPHSIASVYLNTPTWQQTLTIIKAINVSVSDNSKCFNL